VEQRFDVPGPEPEWEAAPSYQGGKRNPAWQHGLWEYATGEFRVIAGLGPPLESLAARLRLDIERSWEDLGAVDVAMFRIQKVDYALSRLKGNPRPDTFVWVSRSTEDVEAALDILLAALGIGREALTFRGDEEAGFEDLTSSPQ
jgi:hypothetical protein